MDTRTPAEIAYDATRLSRAPIAPADDDAIGYLYCPDCTPRQDCPACDAKLAAKEQALRDQAALLPSAVGRARMLLGGGQMPSADLVFDLILEDDAVSFTWHRCIDWVLWRQAHGLPVNRCGEDDAIPAALNARFSQARDYSRNPANWKPDANGRLISLGGTIERWERTPEEEAEHQKIMEITRMLVARFDELGL